MLGLDFFGGVDEIGGNKILVNDGNSSIFLDFGMSFNLAHKYFSEFLQPRKANGLMDFMEFGLLPNIKGIYREDYLRHCGLNFESEPSVQGVLLSHAHMDHSSYIHHLRGDIPIYLTENSYLILKVLEETSKVSFMDLLNIKKDFYFMPKKNSDGHKRLQGDSAKVERDVKIVEPYKNFEIGDYKVKSLPVDHSLPGASGYIVESDEDSLVYTGDIRFHGRNPRLSRKFIKKAHDVNPTVMISEGTRMDSETNVTEKDVEIAAEEVISNHNGLVVINFPVRDLDRLKTFYEVSKETDRDLAVNLKQAYMLDLFQGQEYPSIDDVKIYIPRKGWGLLSDEHYACYEGEWACSLDNDPYDFKRDYEKWERNLLDRDNVITYKELQDEPQNYIYRCDFFELKELIDIKPENGIYIRSLTEPFDEEMEIDYQRVQNWLDHFNLPLHHMHASGHANGNEILNMIRDIQPEKVYPVHTEHVELFDILTEDGIEVIHPNLSK